MAVQREDEAKEKAYSCEIFQQGLTQTKGIISKGLWSFSQEVP